MESPLRQEPGPTTDPTATTTAPAQTQRTAPLWFVQPNFVVAGFISVVFFLGIMACLGCHYRRQQRRLVLPSSTPVPLAHLSPMPAPTPSPVPQAHLKPPQWDPAPPYSPSPELQPYDALVSPLSPPLVSVSPAYGPHGPTALAPVPAVDMLPPPVTHEARAPEVPAPTGPPVSDAASTPVPTGMGSPPVPPYIASAAPATGPASVSMPADEHPAEQTNMATLPQLSVAPPPQEVSPGGDGREAR